MVIKSQPLLQTLLQMMTDLLLHVSEHAELIAIYATDETLGEWVWKNLPKESRIDQIQKTLAMGIVHTQTYYLNEACYEARFAPFAEREALILIRDITAEETLKHFNRELEERVEERTHQLAHLLDRLENFINNSSDGITLVYPERGIQQTNPMFDEMFQSHPDEFFGQPLGVLFDPVSIQAVQQTQQAVIADGQIRRLEALARRHDGSTFYVELGISLVPDASLLCSFRDITERKQSETELRRALEKERELNDLKSRFVMMTSHEFRTPLATILATADTLEAHLDRLTLQQQTQRFAKIRQHVRHMTAMLDEVLMIGRLEAGTLEMKLEKVDLSSFLKNIIEEFQVEHLIAYEQQTPGLLIQGDKKLLRQIITNLLSNATKYSPPESIIDVVLGYDEHSISITIRDKGVGILPEDQPRIFEAFHRGKNVETVQGTGLGLAITKRAVELHGGTITFTSSPQIGTTFRITLPSTT